MSYRKAKGDFYDSQSTNKFIEPINYPCAGLPGLKNTAVPLQPLTPSKTYLHAVANKGWPADHTAEDTFEVPPAAPVTTFPEGFTVTEEPSEPEYHAEYGSKGEAILVIATSSRTRSVKRLAYFDTFADAQLAAEALNNHSGY